MPSDITSLPSLIRLPTNRDRALANALAQVHSALLQADDDCKRLQVRDKAQQLTKAAEVFRFPEIQVQASVLVQRAERAIVLANPPTPRKQTGRGKTVSSVRIVSGKTLSEMRRAHAMPEAVFEELVRKAYKDEVPLTRIQLRAKVRQLEGKQKQSQASGPTYRVCILEPPWAFEGGVKRWLRENKTLPVETHSRVYLWAPDRYLPLALSLFRQWGVTFQNSGVWIVPKDINQPAKQLVPEETVWWVHGIIEGKKRHRRIDMKGPSIIVAQEPTDGGKPDAFYDMLECASSAERIWTSGRELTPREQGWIDETMEAYRQFEEGERHRVRRMRTKQRRRTRKQV